MASFLRKCVSRMRADRAHAHVGSVALATVVVFSMASAATFGQGGFEACCLGGGNCIMDLPEVCLSTGGTPQGPGSSCATNPCAAVCAPTPNGDRCEPVACLNPDQQCAPTEVLCGPTGQCRITACECQSSGGCRIDLDPPSSPFCAPGACPDGSACEQVVTTLPTQETLHQCVCPIACEKPAPAGEDCWSTPCGATQYDFAQTPIPADFFGPGSDPFDGVVQLGGASGFSDTVIARRGDMCFDGPLPVTQQVLIELVQLDLVSCQPITVTFNGGQDPQQWNVKVSTDGQQPHGLMTVTKRVPNGGVFDSVLPVRPRFDFSNGATSLPFQPGLVQNLTVTGTPWVQNPPPFGSVCGNGGFFPGVSPDDPTCCVESCHGGPAPGHQHCVVPPKCPQCPPTPAQPCEECGPGAHWIHEPPCPSGGVGRDIIPSGATLGIDTDFDCIADTSVVLGGPVVVRKQGPLDDSAQFPGVALVDGHRDVIDTEIVSMSLTGGGVTLIAGAGHGAIPLRPTRGAIVEQPTDPLLADSFFDVFVEVSTAGGFVGYNQTPLRVESKIDCLPPDTDYIHVLGCTPIYDSPFAGAVQVGNLVTARHFTYPSCCFDTVCVPNKQPGACVEQGGRPVPECLGDNNGNNIDDACDPPTPECGPTTGGERCEPVDCPDATEECTSTKVVCMPGAPCRIVSCECGDPERCHISLSADATAAVCVGVCPPGMICDQIGTDTNGDNIPDTFECICRPGQTQPCEECGPGPHWIHQPPCPPGGVGQDVLPSGATIGIDTDFDCIADTSLRMHGPVTIRKRGPFDDSNHFPGVAVIDGHRDVVDTEIIAMSLTGGGVTLTAGAGMGTQPLLPSLGTVVEQPGDPLLADSFFDVFVEISDGAGFVAYNQTPLRVESKIDCLPPDTDYVHTSGCTPIYDSPIPGLGAQIGNLVVARHFTYPGCCLDTACIPDLPADTCELKGGTVVPDCLGDNNNNGFDDACEPECGPTPNGDRCEPVDCPATTDECTPTKVVCMPKIGCRVVDCECSDPERCHIELPSQTAPPICVGYCPPGEICVLLETDTNGDNIPDTFKCECRPEQTPQCDECGPGAHWIHNPPCPPGGVGQDVVPSGATIGIDTDFDCIADTSVRLGGPVTIRKRGPLDDSTNFPGAATIDGHDDVVDTEIIAMSLTGGGVTLTAGAGMGALPLQQSLGAVVEQPGDPLLADSFFEMFVEVRTGGGFVGYNHAPLRVESKIDCLPPNGDYVHTSGCTPIYDTPFPGANQVGNLVVARHFTYPACCFGETCVPDVSAAECLAESGTPVADCLGDNNGNNIDDACEPECGPTPNGDRCADVVCPIDGERCVPTKVMCGPGGNCRVVACECRSPNVCHVDLDPPSSPFCTGGCPPGMTCVEHVEKLPTDQTIHECFCEQPEEACCLPDATCGEMPREQCVEMGGEPLGPNSECLPPEPCCLVGDVVAQCVETDPRCCEAAGGIPQGPDATCTERQACCVPDGNACFMVDPLCCDEMGGTPQGIGSVCTDGCPPPPHIVHAEGQPGETRPCSGYIDPKVDSNNGQQVNLGLRDITLVFNEPVFALGGGPLTPASFVVTETGGAAPPVVVAVNASANPLVVVRFSRHITVREWTTTRAIVQNAAGIQIENQGNLGAINEPDRHDVGYMPCDVDQNASCGPFDLLKFRQYVNNIATPDCGILMDYVDINRNGAGDPFDLLVFRQMVNGVSPPTTQVWSGVSMFNPRP